MKVTTFCKFGITAGVAALLVGALAVPASADPATDTYGQLVGLGSDTTQDVVNGLAAEIGDGKLASYDAFGTPTVTVRNGGTAIPRASGSGAGRDALLVAIGQIASKSVSVPPTGTAAVNANVLGQVDFARSSSAPAAGDTTAEGVVSYIPFARDAVSVAVAEGSPLAVVPFKVGSSETASNGDANLYDIYRGAIKYAYISGTAGNYSYVGVGATNTAPQGATAYAIQPLLPKSGSGTRSYFIGKLNLTEPNITAQPTGTIKATYVAGGATVDVQEHDGSALVGDPTAIVPFSIAQWVAQANEVGQVSDRRHGANILGLNGAAAVTQTAGSYATNSAFSALVRDVYNIVPSALADDASSDIAKAFVGTDSLVCTETATILAYGFQLLPGTTAETRCGYTGLRAYTGSTSTVSVTDIDETTSVGEEFSADVTVNAGNHNQGGTVYLVDKATNDALGEATIAAGATTATITASSDTIGNATVFAEFVPKLSGIKSSKSGELAVDVVAQPTVTNISAPSGLTIGKTANVIAWIDGAAPAGGVVTFRDGSTVIGTYTLAAGEQGAFATFVAKKTSYSITASYAAPANSGVADSTSAAKSLTIGKGTPVVSTATVKSVKASSKAKVVVTIKGATGVYATGTVTITEGSKVLVPSKTLSSKGTATVTLPKLKKGTHKITITYNGSDLYNTAVKSNVSVKIK